MTSGVFGFCYCSATGALNSAAWLREKSITPVVGGQSIAGAVVSFCFLKGGTSDLTGIC